MLIGCSPSATPANATQAPAPSSAISPSPSADPGNAQATLAENDRVIAENNRMTAVLQGYARIDPAKLDRLTAQCEAKLGPGYANGGARRIFDCIQAAW